MHESVYPFEARILQPWLCLTYHASMEVKGCPYGDHRHAKQARIFIGPNLLARTTEPYEQQLGPTIADRLEYNVILRVADALEPRCGGPSYDDLRKTHTQVLHKSRQCFFPRPVKIYRQSRLSRGITYAKRQ